MTNLIRHFLSNKFLMIIFIILVGFTAYSFMLCGTFKHMDDHFSIVDNQDIKSFANVGKIFQKPFFDTPYYYRPLVTFSFMAEYHFFDLNPFFYNLTNLLLHLMSAVSIFLIINLIFRDLAVSFFAALLFAIHPIHWEAVSNIPGRAIVLCAFLYFIAFFLFLLGKEKQKAGFFVASAVSFLLALLSKETAITFPIMLLSYEVFIGRKEKKWLHPALQRLLPFVVLAVAYLILRRSLGMNMFHWRYPSEAVLGMMTFLRELISYFRIFIFPTDLYFDRARLVFGSFWDAELLLTGLFFILLFSALVFYRKKVSREFLFFVSWIFIELLPVSQIIPIGIQYAYISTAEHFFYTASLGIFVVIVLFFRWVYERATARGLVSRQVFTLVIAGLFTYFFLITIQQNIYSSNELAMLKRSAQYNRKNARIQTVLGLTYVKKGLFKEAEECFRRTLSVEPFNAAARIALGKTLCDQGRFVEGIKEYEKVENPGKYEKLLKENLRLTYIIVTDQYRKIIAKDPGNTAAHYSLGVMYAKTGKTEEAIAEYRRALELQPDFKNVLFNLASSLEAIGQLTEARELYEKYLTLAPPEDKYLTYYANYHLGLIYEKSGDLAQSKKYFTNSAALDPSFKKK